VPKVRAVQKQDAEKLNKFVDSVDLLNKCSARRTPALGPSYLLRFASRPQKVPRLPTLYLRLNQRSHLIRQGLAILEQVPNHPCGRQLVRSGNSAR
jgi:hypothetical protein